MSKDLSLRVVFSALDKLTGPIQGMVNASKRLTTEVRGSIGEVRKLKAMQAAVAEFRTLKASVEQTREEMTVAAAKARELGKAVATTENPTKALQREFRQARKASEELEKRFREQNAALNKARTELQKAGVSTTDLVRHQRELGDKVEAANRKLAQQKDRLAQLAKAGERGAKIKSGGGAISGAGVTSSLAVSTPIAAIAGSSFKTAMDFNEMASAFDVTFGKYSASARKWAVATGDALHRSTAEIMSMAMSFQDILKKQMDPGQAVELSKRLTVLTQDLASFKNLSNEDAKQKIFSGLIGESEPLRSVGVLLSDNLVKAQALKMGFKSIGKGDFSEGDKVLARAALIQQQLVDANGDVIRTQSSTANQLRAATSSWDEMQLAVGTFLLALTPLITYVTALIDQFNALDPNLQSVITWGALAAAAIGPVLIGFGSLVSIFGGLTTIAAGLGIGLAPLLGIIAAVAVGVGGAAYLIYQNWDWLMKQMRPLFDAIGGLWNDLVSLFKDTGLGDFLKALADGVAGALGGTFLAVLDTVIGVLTGGFNVIGGLIKFVVGLLTLDFGKAWEGLKQAASGAVNALVSILLGIGSVFASIGVNLVTGLVNGFSAAWQGFMNRVKALANMLPDAVKKVLGIHSPSRVFMAIGGHITGGLAQGIERGSGAPLRSIGRMAGAVAGAGALSLAGPSFAASSGTGGAAGARGGGAPITINVYQLPGEDAQALADRVARVLEHRQGRARRSKYEDDF